MNKVELATAIVNKLDTTKINALRTIDALMEVVSDEMTKKDGKLTLVGFGTFKTIVRKKKLGRNPITGKDLIIPKQRVVKFTPGKRLKEMID
jgi:nucleoid DNA-binding protein